MLNTEFHSAIGPPDLKLFETAPQLREVTIRSGSLYGRLELPFHQLTKLSIGPEFPPEKWVEYLRLCPNLIVFEADMQAIATNMITISQEPYLTHRCLRVLRLSGGVGVGYCPIDAVALTLPALQILDLHDDNSKYPHSHYPIGSLQPITDMVSRSGCTFTTFRWSSKGHLTPAIEQDPAIDIHLRAYPHLLNLDISLDIKWISPFLKRLTSQSPCPRLETLDIFITGELAFHEKKSRMSRYPRPPLIGLWLDSQALIIFLQARRAGSHDLRRIRISDSQFGSLKELCDHPEPPEIQTLRDEGMMIVFGSKEVSEKHVDCGMMYASGCRSTGCDA
ncbi:hypothetical protein FIBSPDRAFT_524678 [Athelia psychrophila]|uniref:F-box domain-containing protein n=1 Tax=Athelia psychrophila TaxID=1759441 RepID=A0A166JQC9_9AGAM|nr:hypothetical protein FIBSPDRAFT_524678 [Fibularhizoctonia sp. CBS 109695]